MSVIAQQNWETIKHKILFGNSLVVQWLGLRTFTDEDVGSIPGPGTKIRQPANMPPPPKKNPLVLCCHNLDPRIF